MDILFIAMLTGVEAFVIIALYDCIKQAWLQGLLELPDGIPSQHNFRRVFARLDPKQLEGCLIAWAEALS